MSRSVKDSTNRRSSSRRSSSNWVVARKRLLRRVKSQVYARSGEDSPDLQSYKKQYEKEFKGKWRLSNPDRLLHAVEAADLVLGSDFHAFAQSQRTHLRILRSLPRSKKVALALECVPREGQKIVNAFVRGELSEKEFLIKIEWRKSWGFPWEHYKPLFEYAKKNRVSILALNKAPQLKTKKSTEVRERFAAQIIKDFRAQNSETLVYVIFGDFHLAKNQLPQKLGGKSGGRSKMVVIHQDSSQLYFSLAEKKQENSVRVLEKDNQFCVLTSPPWVKWQNYYFYLEGQGDSALESESVDWTEAVRDLFRIISEDIDLRMKAYDFSVYLLDDGATSTVLKKGLTKKQISVSRWFESQRRSFFVPQGGLFMLASPTVNQAASLFADYVQSRMTGRLQPLWTMPEDFVGAIWLESLGFFVSKIINHRRKPEQIQTLMVNPTPESREVLFLILEQNVDFLRWVSGQGRRPRRYKPRRKASYYLAARLLGGLLGERMYALYRSGKINSKDVLDWLAKDIQDTDFDNFFEDVVKTLKFVPKWAEQPEMRL